MEIPYNIPSSMGNSQSSQSLDLRSYYDVDNHIAVVKAVGRATADNIRITVAEGVKLARAHQCLRLIFDITESEVTLSIVEAFEFGKDIIGSTDLQHRHRVAMIYNPEKYPDGRADFIEDVVTTRPNPHLRLCTTYADAITWLVNGH